MSSPGFIPVPVSGVFPIAPTPFFDDESIDYDGAARIVDYVVDAGVDGFRIANYSEQFSLTDTERSRLQELTMRQNAGRVPTSSPPATTAPGSRQNGARRRKPRARRW